MLLVPDQTLHAVAAGEARPLAGLMLRHTTAEIVGDADIDRAALLAGSHIGVAGHGRRIVSAVAYTSAVLSRCSLRRVSRHGSQGLRDVASLLLRPGMTKVC